MHRAGEQYFIVSLLASCVIAVCLSLIHLEFTPLYLRSIRSSYELRKKIYALKQTWTLPLVVKCRIVRLRTGQPRNRASILGWDNRIFSSSEVRNEFPNQPASY